MVKRPIVEISKKRSSKIFGSGRQKMSALGMKRSSKFNIRGRHPSYATGVGVAAKFHFNSTWNAAHKSF